MIHYFPSRNIFILIKPMHEFHSLKYESTQMFDLLYKNCIHTIENKYWINERNYTFFARRWITFWIYEPTSEISVKYFFFKLHDFGEPKN